MPTPRTARRGISPKPQSAWRYMTIKCGHRTTPEDQAVWAAWKPRGRVYYCDKCKKWLPQQPKPKPAPLPDEPLF
jgi:hypothetical protein